MRGRSWRDLQQPAGGKRLEWLDLDRVPYETAGFLGDHDLARGGASLQALGNVDSVSGDEPVASARVACDHLAARHAHPRLQPHPVVDRELLVQLGQALAHLGRRPNGAERIVLVQMRNPEHGHDRVADELLDGAAVMLEDPPHLLEVALEHSPQQLRVDLLAQRGRTGDVGEDDGDELPELPSLKPKPLGSERRAAFGAELEVVRILTPTTGTRLHRESVGPDLPELPAPRRVACTA